MMRIGIDIHGVLDHHPEKFITLARNIRGQGGKVYIITGPTRMRAEYELCQFVKYNNSAHFWDGIYSIVDYIKENNIPHHYTKDGHLWTNKIEDWNRVKGDLAHELGLDLHFDDSQSYREYFPPGVFCHVERKK